MKFGFNKVLAAGALSVVVSATAASGVLVTFENGNFGVAAVDNKPITDDYFAGAGLKFRTLPFLQTNYASATSPAFLEQKGQQPGANEGPNTTQSSTSTIAFNYNGQAPNSTSAQADRVAIGTGLDGQTEAQRNAALGDFLLRTRSFSRDSLIVTSAVPLTSVSFEIWDIDGAPNNNEGEGWIVDFYSGSWSSPVGSSETPFIAGAVGGGGGNNDLTSYDGQAYLLSWAVEAGSFDRFVIRFGTTAANAVLKSNDTTVGLAFNNFQYTVIPEPAAIGLLAPAALALTRRRR